MNNKTIYKLLEIIEMSTDTKVHMVNGKDYKINEKGELVPEYGEKLPISKKNINNCEFTLIEDLKNYNFRVYKDDYLIKSFNQSNIEQSKMQILVKDLYDQYKDKDEDDYYSIHSLDEPMFYIPRHTIEVKAEEIIGLF